MLRIMVVDDEPMILGGIVSILKQQAPALPLEVEKAGDGIEAVELAESFLPDLVITDLHMPEMNGFEMVEQLQKRSLCKRFIILTGYDDFEYARKAIRYKAIDYLLKPVNKKELIGLVQEAYQEKSKELEVRSKTGLLKIREMIVNRASPDDVMMEQEEADALFGSADRCHYTVIAVRTPPPGARYGEAEELQAKLDGLLPDRYAFRSYYRNEVILLTYASEGGGGDWSQVRQALSASDCSVGISETAASGEHLHGQYLQSQFEIFVSKHFPEKGAVRSPIGSRRQLEGYESVEQLVQTMHEEERRKRVKRYVSEFAGTSDDDFRNLIPVYLQTLFYLQLFLESRGLNLKQIAGALFAEEHLSFPDADAFESKLNGIVNQVLVAAKIVAPEVHSSNRSMQRLLQYIHEHYQEDLSLDQIAEIMGLHPNYISALFKKVTGSTFIQYLQSYRVDQAKELIQSFPDLPLEKISARVGYQNISHFFRVFKKNAGCTPGQYRERV